MKLRTMLTGVVLLGLLVAIWSGGFRGFGWGNGGEGSSEAGRNVSAMVQLQPATTVGDNRAQTSEPASVLEVVIDERSYTVRECVNGEPKYRPVELAELVRLAQATAGNEEGIRVRILRRESSRVTAELLLEDTLTHAGLDKSSLESRYAPQVERPASIAE